VLKDEKFGGLKEAAVVTFTKEHDVFGVDGGGDGKAGQCGRDWTLTAPQDGILLSCTLFCVPGVERLQPSLFAAQSRKASMPLLGRVRPPNARTARFMAEKESCSLMEIVATLF
jgi:hypothetical protein